jgi:hypothetical protein
MSPRKKVYNIGRQSNIGSIFMKKFSSPLYMSPRKISLKCNTSYEARICVWNFVQNKKSYYRYMIVTDFHTISVQHFNTNIMPYDKFIFFQTTISVEQALCVF